MVLAQTAAIYEKMFRGYIAMLVSLAWICWHFHGFIRCFTVMYYSQIAFLIVNLHLFILFRRLGRTIFKNFLLPLHHENKNYIQGHQPYQIQ